MKKLYVILAVMLFVIGITGYAVEDCTTIKQRAIPYEVGHYLEGEFISPGYDDFGYNYQAHMFNGCYANAYLGRPTHGGYPPYEGDDEVYYERLVAEGYADSLTAARNLMSTVGMWQYRNISLMMKWNDEWLSNKDCTDPVGLDRTSPVLGSGAWLTNHQAGTYVEGEVECNWNYFVKIVAVPGDANLVEGIWYAADSTEIGSVIWGSYAKIQMVENDPCVDIHGAQYVSPAGPGFGKF